jgi:predicted  nucleic acid-binding Zn-ribbon protein
MDIRNIIDILAEKSTEVKPNLPINLMESNPGATSDLVKANAPFNAHAEETLNGMVDEFEVQTLDQFLRSKGVKPDFEKADKENDDEDLKEIWTNPPRRPPAANDPKPGTYECTECWGDGTTFDANDEIIVCPKCGGKGYVDTRRVAEEVKHRNSTEYDLATRMLKAKPPVKKDTDKDDPEADDVQRERRWKDTIKTDVDEALKGSFVRKFPEKELTAYLDRILSKDKTKQDKYKIPYVHRSNVIPIVDQEGNKYNLDALAKDITERPKKILKQNEKMQHSDGTTSIFYNVGLPALTGLGYDEAKKEFIIINTCPGAGECKTYCYAMKGGYVQWKSVSLSQTRMLNFLYNDPSGFMEQLSSEIDAEKRKADAKADKTKVTIRWHDAGDFFSPEYLDMAYKLAATHPTVDFYAYTKIADVAGSTQNRPPNFMINFSMGARKAEQKRVDFGTTKHSTVVPRELFNDLIQKDGVKLVKDAKGRIQWNDEEDWDTFKERLAAKYSIKPESIISYDEMMQKPLGGAHADGDRTFARNLWNVVVVPGDGDDSANRADVLGTYLLMH